MADKPSKENFANQSDVSEQDAPLLPSPTDHLGMAEAGRVVAGEIKKPIGAKPASETTGRHDDGSGANETEDGLSPLEEQLRRAAEDIPTGTSNNAKDVPVFDRAALRPKI